MLPAVRENSIDFHSRSLYNTASPISLRSWDENSVCPEARSGPVHQYLNPLDAPENLKYKAHHGGLYVISYPLRWKGNSSWLSDAEIQTGESLSRSVQSPRPLPNLSRSCASTSSPRISTFVRLVCENGHAAIRIRSTSLNLFWKHGDSRSNPHSRSLVTADNRVARESGPFRFWA